MRYLLCINDIFQTLVNSELIPRVGDTIEYKGNEYTVRKVLHEVRKDLDIYIVTKYIIYAA